MRYQANLDDGKPRSIWGGAPFTYTFREWSLGGPGAGIADAAVIVSKKGTGKSLIGAARHGEGPE